MRASLVRSVNASLDARLLTIVDTIDPAWLHELERKPAGTEAWSAAMVLAHLGEFPLFFAGELRRFLADPAAPVGRTHEHPERLAAVEAARGRSLPDLRAGVVAAATALAGALDELADHHLTMTTQNRRYGREPLTAFLDRYVVGHKQGHADQLMALCKEFA